MNIMWHSWKENYKDMIKAIGDYGFGGVVTNVPIDNGFTSNKENIENFGCVIDEIKKNGLSYWIYDEAGYPSGQAGGLTLENHPELQAKGFYMYRRISYEDTYAEYFLNDESDKIVWAAKYPIEDTGCSESYVSYEKMEPISFTSNKVACNIKANEVLYVFCVKNSYEGSHSTHNMSSRRRNINIMDPDAVRRFIDVAYEPIAKLLPDVYKESHNVFTDEPSLQVAYVRSYEVWPYALAPWSDTLLEEYEREYGQSLLPNLPLIFEGAENAYPVRVKFYSLVGKMIANAYSGQLSKWCEIHGCGFSGHYLAEEEMTHHVKDYGDYIKVLSAASYPGVDTLRCFPEIYSYNTTKFAQIASRKNNTNGMMAEYCPFDNSDEFLKSPFENTLCIIGLLYLGGVRHINTYMSGDFSYWKKNKLNFLSNGSTNEEETKQINDYAARIGSVLDGLKNECNTFVYYGIEDAQAKHRPAYSSDWVSNDSLIEKSTDEITKKIYENGFDYFFIDSEDLENAVISLREAGKAKISDCEVKTVIVPALDIMYGSAIKLLKKLQDSGVKVFFMNKLPDFIAETGLSSDELINDFKICSTDQIISSLKKDISLFGIAEGEGKLLIGKFCDGNKKIYMLCNRARQDCRIKFFSEETNCVQKESEIWNPIDGSIEPVNCNDYITVPAMRSLFLVI